MSSFRRKQMSVACPYDTKVEYLESNGTQYIDIGYKGNENSEFECVWYAYSGSAYLYGIASDSNEKSITAYCSSNGLWRFKNRYITVRSDLNQWNHTIQNKLLLNYNDNITNYNSITSFETPSSLFLFGGKNNSGNLASGFNGKIKVFILRENNEEVLHLIPVRKNNIGYMYDTVSGQFFGNSGTGSFTLGPDI